MALSPIPVIPLLHGQAGYWDDLIGFLGIMAVVGGLLIITWHSGRKKQKLRGKAARSGKAARRRR